MANNHPSTLAQAHALDTQGRLSEAVALYQRVIAAEPRNSDALHLLGIAMARMGRPYEAIGALATAVDIQPRNPAMLTNLGNLLNDLGRHGDAVDYFDRALAITPTLAPAHRARGAALLRLGRSEAALQALESAVRLTPNDANVHVDLGAALEKLGRRDQALRHFDRAIGLDPNHAEAHHNRALIETGLGRHVQALASLDRAAALRPGHAAIHANRGSVLADLGRFTEALAAYDTALSLQPGDGIALRHRGRVLLRLERHAQALANFDAAIVAAPQDFEANFFRGLALMQLDRHREAVASFDRALALKKDFAEALNNRGVSLAQLNLLDDALASFYAALRVTPDAVSAHTNAGNTLRTLQRYSEALEHLDRAIARVPADPNLAWSKGLLLLTLGNFEEGWPLFESRLELEHLRPLQRHLHLPRWDLREPLQGETLLVHAEQGLGDTLQFCRYIPMMEARGVEVIFEVQPQLKKLLRSLPMRGEIVGVGETLPSFDVRTPLLSLPLAFGTGLDNIPADAPYLTVEAARQTAWQNRLGTISGFKVGLAWQGNIATEKQGGFHGRSFALANAAPLSQMSGVTWISLQKGQGSEQRAQVSFAEQILQLTDPLEMGADEFVDSAALMMNLDLIITADTVTAHLAGALGIPVWVLLGQSPDWRWLTERSDSPWYPTMQLFRQVKPGDWTELFERVKLELAASIAERPRLP